MFFKSVRPDFSIAYRRAGTAGAVAAAVALCLFAPAPAVAFDLFGWNIFGSDKSANDVQDPVRYSITVTGVDGDILSEVEDSSMLVQDKKKPVSGDLGLVIKARDDRQRILATLYKLARYDGVVTITVDGTAIDDLPQEPKFARDTPVPVTIQVDAGAGFKLGSVVFRGDAQSRKPEDFDLAAGGDAGSEKIIGATDKLIDALKMEGRPLTHLVDRSVIADHDTKTVDVDINVESGPVANMGEVTVQGDKTVDRQFIADWSRLNGGERYSPEKLRKAAERLRKLSVFSSVTIKEAQTLAPDGTIPMTIQVEEGKHRYFGAGIQYSTTDGMGVSGYWGHRNLFGHAESLKIEGSVSRIGETSKLKGMDYSTAIIFSKPGAFGPLTTFTAASGASVVHPDSYREGTVYGSAGVLYELTDMDTLSGGLEVAYSDTADTYGNNRYLTSSIPLAWNRDASNNALNPTSGYRTTLSAKPSWEALQSTAFISVEGSGSIYQSMGADDRVVFAAKLAAGSLLGVRNLDDIAASRRFYAGGGGSVRGYAYQEISPRNADNEALGGRSYVTGSLEARVAINETIGVVPFVDFGTVSTSSVPKFNDFRAGAGIGIRYATPLGPLRLDVAMPLQRYKDGTRFGIYAGIGQAF